MSFSDGSIRYDRNGFKAIRKARSLAGKGVRKARGLRTPGLSRTRYSTLTSVNRNRVSGGAVKFFTRVLRAKISFKL